MTFIYEIKEEYFDEIQCLIIIYGGKVWHIVSIWLILENT